MPKSYARKVIPMKRKMRMPPSQVSTVRAFCASGGLKAVTPSDTASTPVSAAQPDEKALRMRNSPTPSSPGRCGRYGASGRKLKIAPRMP